MFVARLVDRPRVEDGPVLMTKGENTSAVTWVNDGDALDPSAAALMK